MKGRIMEDRKWITSIVECRMCQSQHVAVYPSDADADNLECHECKHMTCEVVTEEGQIRDPYFGE